MTPIEYIDRALALVVDRLARYPGYEVLLSAEKQLQYIRSVLLDRSLDRSALHRLTLGSIAVKEFDETDPELSRALKDAYYVGIRTGRGLKVDLPERNTIGLERPPLLPGEDMRESSRLPRRPAQGRAARMPPPQPFAGGGNIACTWPSMVPCTPLPLASTSLAPPELRSRRPPVSMLPLPLA